MKSLTVIFISIFFVLLLFRDNSLSQNLPGAIKVSTDFDSGNLGKWYIENDTHLVCYPYINYDQNGRNGVSIWFYGRLDNVLNREITIQLKGMQEEYGLKMSIPPYSRYTVHMFSYDETHWERFSNCSYDSSSNTYTIKHIFSCDTVWIAYIEPYTYTRLENFIKEIEGDSNVTIESIGKSVEGRELYLISISEPSQDIDSHPVVWIVARQHPWETASSWAAEGLIKYLISDEPEAVLIRNGVSFKISAIANPDGVFNGVTRFNAKGIDLNRHWDKSDSYSQDSENAPETALLKNAMSRWCSLHRLDFWINIHNNDMRWTKNGDSIGGFTPTGKENELKLFGRYMTEETVFRGPVSARKVSPESKSTSAVVASEFNTISIGIEMKVGYLSAVDRWAATDLHLEYGKGLARAIGRLYNIIKK